MAQQQTFTFALMAVTFVVIIMQIVVMASDSYLHNGGTIVVALGMPEKVGIFNSDLKKLLDAAGDDTATGLLKAARAFSVISLVPSVAGLALLVFYAMKQTMHIVSAVPHVLAALCLFLTFVLEAALYRHEVSVAGYSISLKDNFDLSWGFALLVVMCIVEGVVGGVAVVLARKFGQSGSGGQSSYTGYGTAR